MLYYYQFDDKSFLANLEKSRKAIAIIIAIWRHWAPSRTESVTTEYLSRQEKNQIDIHSTDIRDPVAQSGSNCQFRVIYTKHELFGNETYWES